MLSQSFVAYVIVPGRCYIRTFVVTDPSDCIRPSHHHKVINSFSVESHQIDIIGIRSNSRCVFAANRINMRWSSIEVLLCTDCYSNWFPLAQFNIAITDHAEVTTETRKALGLRESRDERSIVPLLPLCIEITLQTEEGYDMLLEVWTLSIIQELNSPAIRASHTVYSSFGSLLKSIIAVSRATPAYKLSRRTSETYRITHSISSTRPADLTKLGMYWIEL